MSTLPEFETGYADLDNHNFTAEVLATDFARATTATQLVEAWGSRGREFQMYKVDQGRLATMAQGMVGSLARLGLDIDSDDDRITPVLHGIELIEAGEGEMIYGPEPFNSTGFVFAGSMSRLLDGLDRRSDTRLQLAPQVHIETARIKNLATRALEFTKDPAYTQPAYYPRKAWRQVIDPDSPIFGAYVSTDSYTIPDGGPNVGIGLPVSRLYANEVRQLDDVSQMNSAAYRDVFAQGGRLPYTVTAQSLRIGRDDNRQPFDTEHDDIDKLLPAI